MGEKTGLWAVLAAACLITGLVVLAGFMVAPPEHDQAALSAAPARPVREDPPPSYPAFTAVPAVTLLPRPTPTAKPKPAQQVAAPRSLEFTLSSFNVLGSSHTKAGQNHSRFASGPTRARWAAQLVQGHDVEVVGLQELQADQLGAFLNATGGAYDVWPGSALGRLNSENSIAWKRADWTAVERSSFTIPYFGGRPRTMPMVRLKSVETGLEAWFLNVHNPASTPRWGDNERWRDAATAKEIGLVNQLRERDGIPVFFTGDLNEREEFMCRWVSSTAQVAAMQPGGGCRSRIRYVDWVMGSDALFSGYLEDTGALVRRTSDHPMIVTQATIGAAARPATAD